MTDRRVIYTEEVGVAAGFPTEISEETEIWGRGDLAARPSSGMNVGDLYWLETGSLTQIQRWNGSTWVDIVAIPTGVAGGDLQGTYPNPTIGGFFSRFLGTVEQNVVATNTSNVLQTYLSATLPAAFVPAGKPIILLAQYVWSYNSTTQDFLGQVQTSGTVLGVQEATRPDGHRQEPKDAGGPGPTGTNQRYFFSVFDVINPPVQEDLTFEISFASSNNSSIAAIYNGRLLAWRVE